MKPYHRPSKLRHLIALASIVVISATVLGCREQVPAPASAPGVSVTGVRTQQQAMQALLALPELKAWSAEIEQQSKGAAHGAVLQMEPQLTVIDGRRYYPLSFVENSKEQAQRRGNFLVAETGDTILVEESETGKVLTLAQWRAGLAATAR